MDSNLIRPEAQTAYLGTLDHPAYHQQIKLRWYNGRINVFQAVTSTDTAKVLRRLNPTWTKVEHESLALQHAHAVTQHESTWSRLVDEAAHETFGRPYRITDYRISGIACDEFSEPMKQALRFAAHARTYHRQLSGAHACSSGQRRR